MASGRLMDVSAYTFPPLERPLLEELERPPPEDEELLSILVRVVVR